MLFFKTGSGEGSSDIGAETKEQSFERVYYKDEFACKASTSVEGTKQGQAHGYSKIMKSVSEFCLEAERQGKESKTTGEITQALKESCSFWSILQATGE